MVNCLVVTPFMVQTENIMELKKFLGSDSKPAKEPQGVEIFTGPLRDLIRELWWEDASRWVK